MFGMYASSKMTYGKTTEPRIIFVFSSCCYNQKDWKFPYLWAYNTRAVISVNHEILLSLDLQLIKCLPRIRLSYGFIVVCL